MKVLQTFALPLGHGTEAKTPLLDITSSRGYTAVGTYLHTYQPGGANESCWHVPVAHSLGVAAGLQTIMLMVGPLLTQA